jgi:hypothetical protein
VDSCDIDFLYPMKADIYYPIISQNEYGQPNKNWVFDRTVICNAAVVGGAGTEEIKPEVFLQYKDKLIARTKSDLRISSGQEPYADTNILITNIRSTNDLLIYKETAGPRAGRGTIYEIGTLEPFIGPFGNIEYYRMLWRRSENQDVND